VSLKRKEELRPDNTLKFFNLTQRCDQFFRQSVEILVPSDTTFIENGGRRSTSPAGNSLDDAPLAIPLSETPRRNKLIDRSAATMTRNPRVGFAREQPQIDIFSSLIPSGGQLNAHAITSAIGNPIR